MNFTKISHAESRYLTAQRACFLIDDNWDDYNFKTLFQLLVFDESGRRIEVGDVKIAKKGLESGRVVVPTKFTFLGPEYCSLGQSQEYYETLLLIAEDDRIAILEALRDAVWDPGIYSRFEEEAVFQTSLLRGASSSITKFRDVIRRSAQAVPYEFSYTFPSGQPLLFRVTPALVPPTNIHVVIGRTHAGKLDYSLRSARYCERIAATPVIQAEGHCRSRLEMISKRRQDLRISSTWPSASLTISNPLPMQGRRQESVTPTSAFGVGRTRASLAGQSPWTSLLTSLCEALSRAFGVLGRSIGYRQWQCSKRIRFLRQWS